jgi:spermidine/putrescine transport system permease protein
MTALSLGEAERRRISDAEARVDQAKRQSAAQQRRTRWSLVAPALLVIGLFGIGPLLIMLIYSFLEPGTYGGVRWEFSTDAYVQFLFERDLFDDTKLLFTDSYLQIIGRSVLLGFVTTVICLILGYPTAYFMATRPPAQRNFWVFLITLPFWTNLLIRTYAMFVILRDDGIINNALLTVGIISSPIPIMFTDYAIAIGLLYAFLPLMVLPLYASLEKLDFRMVEAGFDLYATRGRVLRRIVVPLSKPGIVAGCILVFIPAIGAYVTPTLMGGGKQLMIGNLIALQFQGARNWPFGAALALILMLLVMIALLLYTRNATRQQAAIHG